MEEYLSCFLPEDLLLYFNITKVEELGDVSSKNMVFHIHLEEKNIIPEQYPQWEYESKGFTSPVYVQDFPIRGKAVYLVIKRRHWRHKINKQEIVTRRFDLMSKGGKLTQELSDFLKSPDKFERRFD